MNFHRYYIPGQTVFITQVVKDRRSTFDNPEMIKLLRTTLRNVKEIHPYNMLGYAFLPDHFHLLFQPSGGSNFCKIMLSLKFNFTISYKKKIEYSGSLTFWQKRFWDHVIRDEKDFENHIHYIHYNPIKHGYVTNLEDWEQSSFSEWYKRGLYERDIKWQEPVNSYWGE